MGTTLGKRYAPLLALAAIQLLIIIGFPSKAVRTTDLSAGGGDGTSATVAGGGADGTGGTGGAAGDPTAGGDTTGAAAGGVGGTTGASGATSGAGGSTAGGATGGTGGASTGGTGGSAAGDTSHCVGGRQFDPKIDADAPPCVPKFTGTNPGATYQGVTAKDITIIQYYGKGSAAVDAIEQAESAYFSADQVQTMDNAVADFINAHYELYGRKVSIQVYQGSCDTIPPDYSCLQNEVKQINASKHPYALFWNTSIASAFYAEASNEKIVNMGGWHFRQAFNTAWAPYHYDVQMSGSKIAQNLGSWYCAQMNGKKAVYANDPNLAKQTRKLGVISTNDPENKATVAEMKTELQKCGATIAADYYYAEDINTAATQVAAAVSKMQQAGVTSEMCVCDLVAPSILYNYQDKNGYRPEVITTGTGFLDADAAGQAYTQAQLKNALGLSSIGAQEPNSSDLGARWWHAAGRTGDPPYPSAAQSVEYFSMLASMLQAAGPTLNPRTMAAGAARLPTIAAGAHNPTRSLNGDQTWNDDMRLVYYDPDATSPFNGKKGSYIDVTPGKRYTPGTYPTGDFTRPIR